MDSLQAVVQRQGQEILWLRAVTAGLVEVLHEKSPFDSAELELAALDGWLDRALLVASVDELLS